MISKNLKVTRTFVGILMMSIFSSQLIADEWYVSEAYPATSRTQDTNDFNDFVGSSIINSTDSVLSVYLNGTLNVYENIFPINKSYINNTGMVAGSFLDNSSELTNTQAFFLQDDIYTNIALNSGYSLVQTSTVSGLNDFGTVIGNAIVEDDGVTKRFMYIWNAESAQMIDVNELDTSFDLVPLGYRVASGKINNLGNIVGIRITPNIESRFELFVYEDNKLRILDIPEFCSNSGNSQPGITSMNNQGAFVGFCKDGLSTISFLYDENGNFSYIPLPENASEFLVREINDLGQISGSVRYFDNPNSPTTAFYNRELGQLINFEDMLAPNEGAFGSNTAKLNNAGDVVIANKLFTLVNNLPPYFTEITPQTVNEGELITYQIPAADYDMETGNVLTYSVLANTVPQGVTLDSATGVLNWTPSLIQSGSYSFDVTVTDNAVPAESATATLNIEVKNVNVAPELISFQTQFDYYAPSPDVNTYDVEFVAGEFILMQAAYRDYDDNEYVVTLDGLPAGAPAVSQRGYVAWTTTEEQIGTYRLTYTATDNGNPNLTSEPIYVNLTISPSTPSVDDLILMIQNDITELAVTDSEAGKLLSRIDKIIKNIENMSQQDAINLSGSLINQINRLVNKNKITTEQGDVLIDLINQLIESIQE